MTQFIHLEHAILGCALQCMPQGWDVTPRDDDAINSYDEIKAIYDKTGRVLVSSAHCDNTIYSDPSINVALRAWHDFIHVTKGYKFTREGEAAVCKEQQKQAVHYLSKIGVSIKECVFVSKCLRIELTEQLEYYCKMGEWVKDQKQFMLDHLEYGVTP